MIVLSYWLLLKQAGYWCISIEGGSNQSIEVLNPEKVGECIGFFFVLSTFAFVFSRFFWSFSLHFFLFFDFFVRWECTKMWIPFRLIFASKNFDQISIFFFQPPILNLLHTHLMGIAHLCYPKMGFSTIG